MITGSLVIGMHWLFLALVLGFAYIVFAIAEGQEGNAKSLGQGLALLIVAVLLGVFLTGGGNRGICQRSQKMMMGRGMMEMRGPEGGAGLGMMLPTSSFDDRLVQHLKTLYAKDPKKFNKVYEVVKKQLNIK